MCHNDKSLWCFLGVKILHGGVSGQEDVSSCTFHCRVRLVLARFVSFGGDGTSGTVDSVVNEPASEHEPRTKLYIADTLIQKDKWNKQLKDVFIQHFRDSWTPIRCNTQVVNIKRIEALPYVVVCSWPEIFQMILQFFTTETQTRHTKSPVSFGWP